MNDYESLKNLISNSNPNDLTNYRIIATNFQKLVNKTIKDIWEKHDNQISMNLNDVPICLENSAVNSSTAFGYLYEEFIAQQLNPKYFVTPKGSTTNSAYDFKFIDDTKIELLVNLKAEKKNNPGICAANILINHYRQNSKPKLYLIFKSKYSIDTNNSNILFQGTESFYLESFIMSHIKSDSRNWSKEFKPLSGRIQAPTKTKMKKFSIQTIPEPEKILNYMNYNFAEEITKSKNQ